MQGICYGDANNLSDTRGIVQSSSKREFGKAEIKILEKNLLFKGIDFSKNSKSSSLMSHGDEVKTVPKGF